ncbi:homoserine kinase [Micrococcus luteus]
MAPMRELPVGRSVRVAVPATSANLGPGFDTLGLALELRDEVTFTVVDGPSTARVTGEGQDSLPDDGTHLIVRLALEHLARRGATAPGLALEAHNVIPHSRGLGSSAAAVVAALAGADGLLEPGDRLDADGLLDACARREGHPDNVAPALAGGATASWIDDATGGFRTAGLRLHPDVVPVIAVPDTRLATHTARGLLPETVPHAVAAAQAGRAALLSHALAEDPELLLPATRDWLHQDFRAAAMPDSARLITALRRAGHAAVVSGAGPTVLVLAAGTAAAEEAAGLLRAEAASTSARWEVTVTAVAAEGVRVETLHHG